jgi:uncharacterized protein (DUF934 family)
MPLLKDGLPVSDHFVIVTDTDPLPANGPVIVGLNRWRTERETLLSRNEPVGVKLKSSELAGEIAADLGVLALVAVELPKFRDGRAFSTARELRERYRFPGEIRAVGHIIPDQYVFLLRAGVSTVLVPEGRDLSAWSRALTEFSIVYQPGVYRPDLDGDEPLSVLRRHLTLGGAA